VSRPTITSRKQRDRHDHRDDRRLRLSELQYFHVRAEVRIVARSKPFVLVALTTKRLHNTLARKHFREIRREVGDPLLRTLRTRRNQTCEKCDHEIDDGGEDEEKEREQPVDVEHCGDRADECHERNEELRKRDAKRVRHQTEIVREACDEFARPPFVELAHRHPHRALEEAAAQGRDQTLSAPCGQIALTVRSEIRDEVDDEDADDDLDQEPEGMLGIADHAVDDERERLRKRERAEPGHDA
jgi:hypothetical protein